MKLINLSVADFTGKVDSSEPAPGGGSVSALSGALGAASFSKYGVQVDSGTQKV